MATDRSTDYDKQHAHISFATAIPLLDFFYIYDDDDDDGSHHSTAATRRAFEYILLFYLLITVDPSQIQ